MWSKLDYITTFFFLFSSKFVCIEFYSSNWNEKSLISFTKTYHAFCMFACGFPIIVTCVLFFGFVPEFIYYYQITLKNLVHFELTILMLPSFLLFGNSIHSLLIDFFQLFVHLHFCLACECVFEEKIEKVYNAQ